MAAPQDMIVIVEPMIPALRRYARALLRNQDEADDLVQDCLERAVSRWHQRRGDGNARTWLFTILHNLAVNRMRTRVRRGGHVTLEDADPAALSDDAGQEHALHHRDILAALDRLPDEQRQLLLLIALEGVSYAEAADIIGAPVGTVMSRLSRGRERLRLLLAGEATAPARPALRRIK